MRLPVILLTIISFALHPLPCFSQCPGGGIWTGGTPAIGSTNVTGTIQGSVSVNIVTTGNLAAGRPGYSLTNDTYAGNTYRSLLVYRGASGFGTAGTKTTFTFSKPLDQSIMHIRVRDIRGDLFNTESQRVEGFLDGSPVTANFTDFQNGAYITGGNIIAGPGSTTSSVQASARAFFSGPVNQIVVTATSISDYIVMDLFARCAILLPFRLLDIQARKDNSSILLTWQTGESYGFDWYDIERSPDGRNWEKIGEKNVTETTGGPARYAFRDNLPLTGQNFYRLRSREFSGAPVYSEIVSIRFEGDQKVTTFRAMPNPFTSHVLLEAKGLRPGKTLLTCYAGSGRIIHQGILTQTRMSLETGTWPPGVYLVRLTYADGSFELQKLVKQ